MEESLTLSADHQKALQQGESVPVDVFERIKNLLADFDPREAYPALDEVIKEDWSDPRMAEYDDYESRKK